MTLQNQLLKKYNISNITEAPKFIQIKDRLTLSFNQVIDKRIIPVRVEVFPDGIEELKISNLKETDCENTCILKIMNAINYTQVDSWGIRDRNGKYLCWSSPDSDDLNQVNTFKINESTKRIIPLTSGFLLINPDSKDSIEYLSFKGETKKVSEADMEISNFSPLKDDRFIFTDKEKNIVLGKYSADGIQTELIQKLPAGVKRFDVLNNHQILITNEKVLNLKNKDRSHLSTF